MSKTAYEGLEAAVLRYNPPRAIWLLDILRQQSGRQHYRHEDSYGPLSIMLFGALNRRRIAPGITVPTNARPLSEKTLAACRTWNEEWLRRDFSQQEIADAMSNFVTIYCRDHAPNDELSEGSPR